MSTPQAIYAEVKPDLAALAGLLLEQSEKLLRERGTFLPHAAVLNQDGKVSLLGAICSTPGGFATSTHILPMLRDGLRSLAAEKPLKALAFAENASVMPDGVPGQAIRVLIEHSRGIAMVVYVPFTRGDYGEYTFGSKTFLFTEPEVDAWNPGR